MKKIGVVSVGRSDFGLLFPLINELKKNNHLSIKFFAAAGHYSKFSGETVNEITKKGIKVDYKIKCSINDDSKNSTNLIFARAIKLFSLSFVKSKIQSIILFGDRFEMLAAAIAARNNGLQIFHIGGGCTTLGALDNMYRHNISILSDYHFVDLIRHKENLYNFGIDSKKIFVVGSFGAASLNQIPKLNFSELKNKLNFNLSKKFILYTYHSTTMNTSEDKNFIKTTLDYFINKEYQVIITNPNEDFNRKSITKIYKKYLYYKNFILVKNFGHDNYANLLRHASVMVGNSSSGIIEAETFNLPVINLGKRQKGRVCSKNVIHIENFNKSIIFSKLDNVLNRKKLKNDSNKLYFKKNTFKRISNIIYKKIISN